MKPPISSNHLPVRVNCRFLLQEGFGGFNTVEDDDVVSECVEIKDVGS